MPSPSSQGCCSIIPNQNILKSIVLTIPKVCILSPSSPSSPTSSTSSSTSQPLDHSKSVSLHRSDREPLHICCSFNSRYGPQVTGSLHRPDDSEEENNKPRMISVKFVNAQDFLVRWFRFFSKWLLEISDGDMMDIHDIHGYYQLKTQQMNCRSIWTDSLRLMMLGWRFDIYNRRSASALGGEV